MLVYSLSSHSVLKALHILTRFILTSGLGKAFIIHIVQDEETGVKSFTELPSGEAAIQIRQPGFRGSILAPLQHWSYSLRPTVT